MGTDSAEPIAVEIVWLRGKSGSKKDLVPSFKKMFDLSTEVAIEGGTKPALGLKAYNTVGEHLDDACMFLYWKSVEQHDNLAANPKFEAGSAKLMSEEVLPKLERPIESFYVHSTSNDLVLSDADCVESGFFPLTRPMSCTFTDSVLQSSKSNPQSQNPTMGS